MISDITQYPGTILVTFSLWGQSMKFGGQSPEIRDIWSPEAKADNRYLMM